MAQEIAVLQMTTIGAGVMTAGAVSTAMTVFVAVTFPFWLLSSLMKGEMRFKSAKVTKRDEEPVMFWMSWVIILLFFIVAVLALAGVDTRIPFWEPAPRG
jgi:polyferredoxin